MAKEQTAAPPQPDEVAGLATSAAQSELQNVGIHTDEMVEALRDRGSELQQLLEDEIRQRPLRALGWAALAGLVFGVMAARN
ncbi:hypothetical protein AB4Z10_00045 [Bosea sp. RAF48]|uniref:hypothetical protein n=1 Tax=Bosea sp. RAF48 TaxID=3237480 RepID=UPI003F8EA57A